MELTEREKSLLRRHWAYLDKIGWTPPSSVVTDTMTQSPTTTLQATHILGDSEDTGENHGYAKRYSSYDDVEDGVVTSKREPTPEHEQFDDRRLYVPVKRRRIKKRVRVDESEGDNYSDTESNETATSSNARPRNAGTQITPDIYPSMRRWGPVISDGTKVSGRKFGDFPNFDGVHKTGNRILDFGDDRSGKVNHLYVSAVEPPGFYVVSGDVIERDISQNRPGGLKFGISHDETFGKRVSRYHNTWQGTEESPMRLHYARVFSKPEFAIQFENRVREKARARGLIQPTSLNERMKIEHYDSLVQVIREVEAEMASTPRRKNRQMHSISRPTGIRRSNRLARRN